MRILKPYSVGRRGSSVSSVAMSVRIEGIHHAKHSFDVDSSTRISTTEGQSQNELLIGHINHNGPDLSSGSGQAL